MRFERSEIYCDQQVYRSTLPIFSPNFPAFDNKNAIWEGIYDEFL